MKKIIVFIMGLLGILAASNITLTGEISGNQEITADTCFVNGEVEVLQDAKITINQGTKVIFNNEAKLIVRGKIEAIGIENDSIFFQGNENKTTFQILESNQENKIAYASFRNFEYGLKITVSYLDLSHSLFQDNDTGISISGFSNETQPDVKISNCLITHSQKNGIFILGHKNAVIENCEITKSALSQSPRGAIQLSCQSEGGFCTPTIRNNYIHHNVWQGISSWDLYESTQTNPIVEGNTITYNLSGVYLKNSNGIFRNNDISYNFVEGNSNSGAGVMIQGATCNPLFTANNITHNFTGFYIIQGATANIGNINNSENDDDGNNIIKNNVDPTGHTWSIYNMSSKDIMAQNNDFGTLDSAQIAESIFDYDDNPSYGKVTFTPSTSGINEENTIDKHDVRIYPNPFNSSFCINFLGNEASYQKAVIYNYQGQKIREIALNSPMSQLKVDFQNNLQSGIYFVKLQGKNQNLMKKILFVK